MRTVALFAWETALVIAGLLSIPEAILLGLVEGITEFLPVSSTGHLLFVQELIGLGGNGSSTAADTYAVAIQFGAIMAVLWLYRDRLWSVFRGMAGRDRHGRALLVNLLGAFLPAAIVGVVFGDSIKDSLFGPVPVIAAWSAGGLLLLVWTPRPGRIEIEDIPVRTAVIIGLAQVLAMWPGVSRSLATLVAGLALGLSLASAVEFTFLLGVVTLSAAAGLDMVKHGGDLIDTFGVAAPLVGLVVALVSAAAAVRWMVGYLTTHSLRVFGWYRLAAAAAGLALVVSARV